MPAAPTRPADRGPRFFPGDPRPGLVAELAALPPGHPSRARLREEAIAAWLPMARRLARRYAGRGEALDDLVQAATIGLINAVDRFDPAQGADFTGYAIPTVIGELKRHFRDRAWSVRVPRRLQEMRIRITGARDELAHTLGRPPTVADVAAHLGVDEEAVLEGLEGGRAYSSTSLSTPVGPDGELELGDSLGAEDDDYARTELRLSLTPALASLTERERMIVTSSFYGNQTQSRIAGQLGISQMHVSRLLAGALIKLRAQLGPEAG
ncbi:SigB/SigF/SigG family RNA polymerase sigma factor [Actinoplanes sp. RD1]|uniref:SigB/SigF/SigG family RNA polymerase sigma factor n=1 Tax=Actinoplanes sp. RD1 TaxID=3064538 RepID=UPI00274129C6|nr:SigB/SigF/SigG family RNA polymerase sigma factor [Actinoplanes sp. RD1]